MILEANPLPAIVMYTSGKGYHHTDCKVADETIVSASCQTSLHSSSYSGISPGFVFRHRAKVIGGAYVMQGLGQIQ